ncbi:MAG: electron transport complex subunit RsxG [Gammaproteobacteria bacterium]|jgi:Na+-translocating ferredoxin:NAD+ oxidoreductase subunit G|nr:electron transport complex subunit RsxG [Gammaproteobacteria bacterium]MBU0769905.1 electron transport complex subunit RsxG [Gammaproteobacteria bacterium]MBU0856290.1 electron transport complex subunit RsxG [Gammaproteobacteria bacterium]MBU1847757.1 electron transport complex subunit RsxG [Gammaproteobacteria bacterium]
MSGRRLPDAVWYPMLSLGVVALVTTAILAFGQAATRGPIAQAQADDTRQLLEQILPAGYADNNLLTDTLQMTGPDGAPLTVHRARKGGALRAVLFEMSGNGYGGRLTLLMAVAVDGDVVGVRVTHHNETPGLGDKVDAAKSDWVLSFNGRSLGKPEPARWAVKKDGGDFDQFAGATITPRAVVATVKRGLAFFAAHRDDMMATAARAGQNGSGGQHE